MEILQLIFFGTLTLFCLVCIFILLTLINNKVYCYVWEHKEWKLWEEFIKRIDEFEFDNGLYLSYQFNIPGTGIQAHVWKNDENGDDPVVGTTVGYCSLHNKSECLCCTFDRYHSKKMADLLMEKIKTENV